MTLFQKKHGLLKQQYRWRNKMMVVQLLFQSFYMVIFLAFLITAGCLFYLWQWTQYLQFGYHIQELEQQQTVLERQLELLEVEISYLSRPQRLESIAVQALKMRPPAVSQYMTLDSITDHE